MTAALSIAHVRGFAGVQPSARISKPPINGLDGITRRRRRAVQPIQPIQPCLSRGVSNHQTAKGKTKIDPLPSAARARVGKAGGLDGLDGFADISTPEWSL